MKYASSKMAVFAIKWTLVTFYDMYQFKKVTWFLHKICSKNFHPNIFCERFMQWNPGYFSCVLSSLRGQMWQGCKLCHIASILRFYTKKAMQFFGDYIILKSCDAMFLRLRFSEIHVVQFFGDAIEIFLVVSKKSVPIWLGTIRYHVLHYKKIRKIFFYFFTAH